MSILNFSDGSIELGGGLRLYAGEPVSELLEDLQIISDFPEPPPAGAVLPFPACEAGPGRLAPVCAVGDRGLMAVTLWPFAVAGKKPMTVPAQRAYLFACIDSDDPCPDSMRPVIMRRGFGSVIISADPHTGISTLQVRYRL